MNSELNQLIDDCEKYISQNGIDENIIETYYNVCQLAKNEGEIDTMLKCTTREKELIEKACMRDVGIDIFELEKYTFNNNIDNDLVNRYFDTLLLEAPHLFHSYLLYLEKDREESERFYQPKMKQLNKYGLIQAMQDLEDDKYNRLCISMPPGTQKAQPLYSKVLTPDGWKTMKDICVGSKVLTPKGHIVSVLEVYPHGKHSIYELTFDDGSKCRCSDEHLWTVQTRDDRRRKNKDGSEKYRTITLKEMLKNYKVENGKRCNYSVDYVGKIDFEKKNFIIHPYVMGVLLGDGGLTDGTPNVSTTDEELLRLFNEFLPKGYFLKFKDRCTYSLCGHEGSNSKSGSIITKELKKYGLFKHRSIEKFIPKEYLFASYEQRLWILRGLLDTDGSASKSYCSYATISEQLADDVVELVHSLGGYASKNRRKAGYKKNGEYIRCNDYFEIIIEFQKGMDAIFGLKRKNDIYKPKREKIKRFITDIKYIEEDYCKCILIDDEEHLYITDDYVVTHNTTLEKFFCSWIIGKHPKDYSLFFSHSNEITGKFYKGVLDITTDDKEYKWNVIFPNLPLQSTNAQAQEANFGKYKAFSSIQCSSIGAKNAGKVRTNRYLYCDDLIGSIEEALNPIILEKIWRIYGVDLKQRKLNEQVKEIIIMTRWSTKDIIGHIIELYGNDPKLKVISIPDIDPKTGKSNFDYEYNGMSVEFFNDQALTMDDISYRCLYKQDPIEREGLLYPENKIMRYKELPKTRIKRITGQCDTKSSGTDFYVFPCLVEFEGYEGTYYCVDTICNNSADYEKQYENSANLIVDNEMQDCDFEANQGGDRVANEVRKRVEEKGWLCNISDTATETNKEARIFQCSSWVLQHIVFKDRSLYEPKSDYAEMMSWLLKYSVSGKNLHDDVPDVFSNFALRMTKGNRTAKVEAAKNPFRRY